MSIWEECEDGKERGSKTNTKNFITLFRAITNSSSKISYLWQPTNPLQMPENSNPKPKYWWSQYGGFPVMFSVSQSWHHENILICLCQEGCPVDIGFCQWASEVLYFCLLYWVQDPWTLLGEHIWRGVPMNLDVSACHWTPVCM